MEKKFFNGITIGPFTLKHILVPSDVKLGKGNTQIKDLTRLFTDDMDASSLQVRPESNSPVYSSIAVKERFFNETEHVDFAWLGEFEATEGKYRNSDLVYLIRRNLFEGNAKIQKTLREWGKMHVEKECDIKELHDAYDIQRDIIWSVQYKIDPAYYHCQDLKVEKVMPKKFSWV